mgnify:CR=1 FL=1
MLFASWISRAIQTYQKAQIINFYLPTKLSNSICALGKQMKVCFVIKCIINTTIYMLTHFPNIM